MNHTDAHGTGDHRRSIEGRLARHDSTEHVHHPDQAVPAANWEDARSITMHGSLHEQLARERHREAYLEARRFRLQRAFRAQRRAGRAAEIAVRAVERAGLQAGIPQPNGRW
jgi:hypothetical protein